MTLDWQQIVNIIITAGFAALQSQLAALANKGNNT